MRPLLLLTILACAPAVAVAVDSPPGHHAEIGLFLIEITGIDELAGTFTAEFDVVSRWQDPARAWPVPADAPDRRTFVDEEALAELHRGWWPALHAVNGVGGYERGILRVTVRADGTVTNRARLRMTLRAPLDFRAFPFDRQELPVHVESVLEPASRLGLTAAGDFAGFADDFAMPEWRLAGMSSTHSVVERRQEGQPYARVSFHIGVERLSGYYLWKIMLPLAIIVMISWIVFWMSEEGLGRRAGVSSTGMLTVIAYQFVVAGSLPRFPYLTTMDRVSLTALMFIAATMLINLLGSRRAPEGRLRLDRVCRLAFPVAFAAAVAVELAR